ncbi:hypothetical protein ACVD1N_25150 [Vibrio parahaemolyticus]
MTKKNDEIYLNDMQVEEKGVSMQLSGSPLHILADSFVEQFKETGAENYLEIKFTHKETQEVYTLTIQKASGMTPADKCAKLTKERDYLLTQAAVGLQSSISLHNFIVGNQAAIIEAESTQDPAKGLRWVSNRLFGPGFLDAVFSAIDEGQGAQAFFDANETDYPLFDEAKKKISEVMEKELAK